MKYSLVALTLLATTQFASATEPTQPANQSGPAVEQYNYSKHLDIAEVISIDEVPAVCQVVPVRMKYADSHGVLHVMEYQVMGNGCGNG